MARVSMWQLEGYPVEQLTQVDWDGMTMEWESGGPNLSNARNYRPLRQVIDHPVRRNGDHCCRLDVRSSDGVQGGVESGDSRSGAPLAVRHQPAAYINWYWASCEA